MVRLDRDIKQEEGKREEEGEREVKGRKTTSQRETEKLDRSTTRERGKVDGVQGELQKPCELQKKE